MMNISITIMIKSLIRMILSFNISNIYIYNYIYCYYIIKYQVQGIIKKTGKFS